MPKLFSLDCVWSDDELNTIKGFLRSIDEKNRLNSEAFFYDSWYLPILKQMIKYDIDSDNIISIYHPIKSLNELWIIVKDLKIVPKIDMYGVFFTTSELFNKSKVREKDLLYGKNFFRKWKDLGEFLT